MSLTFSIITPSYNQGRYIEQTIQSVLNQNYPNLEYVIIDGGSTDNTVEIIKKYEKHVKFWISEEDKGQANAINKGLNYCTGEIFNWLNSDDYLEPCSLMKIAAAFEDKKVQMVAGKVRNFSLTEEIIIQNQKLSAEGIMLWKPGVQFVQPGVWLRRNLIERAGGIDENYHYSFDWDLYIRYLYHFPFVKEIPDLLVHFRLHNNSKTQSSIEKFLTEELQIIKKLSLLNEFTELHNACNLKIQKAEWTAFLSKQSRSTNSFTVKLLAVLRKMNSYQQHISYSRQTAGAIKAFWKQKEI
ncbi:MAG: glycosyltransferase family 2 protein [Ginsengibacter sp.]